MNDIAQIAWQLPKIITKGTIRFYQMTISPDHGPLRHLLPYGACKFHPTCSNYAIEAVDEHGVIKGLIMGAGRIMRCHPFADGGLDPVPKRGEHDGKNWLPKRGKNVGDGRR